MQKDYLRNVNLSISSVWKALVYNLGACATVDIEGYKQLERWGL